MSPERLKKVEEIFHAVLEVPPRERVLFLSENCGNDAELQREVESLLSFENEFDSLIDSAPKSLVVEIFSAINVSNIIGKQINQYKITKKVGEGGMGVVYLAQDTKLERKVALKLLSDEFSKDKTRVNRFFQEAKSASALNHPNILTVHEIGKFKGTHFIITEFINGRTLNKFLAEEKPTLQSVLELATQIASALAAAHEAGIIHRDIKPDNIMVRNDGLVKVLDFGIAKLMDIAQPGEVDNEAETRAKPATLPGMIIGTPQYMSPEQARGQKIDLRSDVFSFGVVLYEMIAGKPPFVGVTKMDIIGSILKDEPKSLSEYQQNISPNLEHIVNKALRKDREQRYQHVKDLFIDLNDFKKTLEFDTKLVIHQTDFVKAKTTVNTTSSIVTQRRFSLIHAFLFLLMASGIMGIIWWVSPKTKPNNEQLKSIEVVSWASKPGEVYSVGTFSPDGKMVAFTSTKSGSKNIWIKQTGSGEAIQITKDEFRNENPIWSPSGEEIAYFSTKGDKAGFWRVPVLGGSPKLIASVEDGSSLLRFWSKQNLIYFQSKHDLFSSDPNSGQIKRITDFGEKQIQAHSLQISPNEQHLAYTTVEGEEWAIWAKPIKDPVAKKLWTSRSEIRNIVWHPDNQKFFYSTDVEGTYQIFVLNTDGSRPQQISMAERDCYVLDSAPDGSKILYGSAKEESDIWGFNLREGKEFTVASDIDAELWADVSPDGKIIAYQSIRNLSQGNKLFSGKLLAKNLGSEGPATEISDNGGLPVWSPDGKSLAYVRQSENKNLIEITSPNGGQKQILSSEVNSISYALLPYNRVQTRDFEWSPDSEKIVYLSQKNGFYNLWLARADGSEEIQLTDNRDKQLYFNCPLWSPDGKYIAYTSKTGTPAGEGLPSFQIWRIEIATKEITSVTPPGKFLRLIGWGQNSYEILFVTTTGSDMVGLQPEVTVHRLDIKTGAVREIAKVKDTYLFNIHLSPDGKYIAFAAHREDKDNLWLIPAGGGAEKKLTANNDSRLYFSSLAWSPDNNSIFFGKQSRYSLLSMLTNFK